MITNNLESEIHFILAGMGETVAAEVDIAAIDEDEPESIAEGMVLIEVDVGCAVLVVLALMDFQLLVLVLLPLLEPAVLHLVLLRNVDVLVDLALHLVLVLLLHLVL